MPRYILQLVPLQIAQVFPPATCPAAHRLDNGNFLLDEFKGVLTVQVDDRHNLIH